MINPLGRSGDKVRGQGAFMPFTAPCLNLHTADKAAIRAQSCGALTFNLDRRDSGRGKRKKPSSGPRTEPATGRWHG